MKTKEQERKEFRQRDALVGILLLLLFISLAGNANYLIFDKGSSDSDQILKQVIIIDEKTRMIGTTAEDARHLYDLASISYDLRDYDSVISNCLASREKSNKYMQDVRVLLADIKSEGEIFDNLRGSLEASKDIYLNLYEACEYLESIARNLDNNDYELANLNIDKMNEKIELHDEAVERQSQYIAEYVVLLEDLD